MIYNALAQLLALLLDLLVLLCRSDHAKDLEILALRQQLRILHRTQPVVRPTRSEKIVLAMIAATLKRAASRVGQPWQHSLLLFTPATVLRWHRELVRRKWTYTDHPRRGRPGTPPETQALIVRRAHKSRGYRGKETRLCRQRLLSRRRTALLWEHVIVTRVHIIGI